MIVRGASSMNTLHGLRTVLGFNWNSLKLPDISRKEVIVLWSISSNNTVKHQNELSLVLDILYSFQESIPRPVKFPSTKLTEFP